MINALTDRLYQEELDTQYFRGKRNELDAKVLEIDSKYLREKHELEWSEDHVVKLREQVDNIQKRENDLFLDGWKSQLLANVFKSCRVHFQIVFFEVISTC